MSDFTELRDDIAAIGKAVDGYSATAVTNLLEQSRQIDRLWADNAELRDEINAVANRVESLTRAVMADPAEVAQAIVNDANRDRLHALTGRPLVLAGGSGDYVDCLPCRGSGITPERERCDKCGGMGKVRHQ